MKKESSTSSKLCRAEEQSEAAMEKGFEFCSTFYMQGTKGGLRTPDPGIQDQSVLFM